MRKSISMGKRMRLGLILVIVAWPLNPANAQALSEKHIRDALFGRTLVGEYASGSAWRETFGKDGTSSYEDNGSKAQGTMTFKGRHLCFSYNDADTLSGGCFEIWQRGKDCFDFYGTDQSGGTAATYTQKSRGHAWDARGWNDGKKEDCVADLIS